MKSTFVAALALGGWVGAACTPSGPPAPKATEVVAKFVPEVPRLEPNDERWSSAPELLTKLLLQDQAPPKLDRPGVETVRVRALRDDQWLSFRLEWSDPSVDELVAAARFGDMAAVQLPFMAGADVPDGAMGQVGRPVRISLWRASHDHDHRTGKDQVSALYPNAVVDHFPPDAAGAQKEAMALLYAPARANRNPVASRRPDSSTEDLVAEGFGSLSPAAEQVSMGQGAHADSAWRVVISRPLDAKEGEALRPGGRTYVAFAIWQGADGNVGSRKMRSAWVPLTIEAKGAGR